MCPPEKLYQTESEFVGCDDPAHRKIFNDIFRAIRESPLQPTRRMLICNFCSIFDNHRTPSHDCLFHSPQANYIEKSTSEEVLFSAKDYLNGTALGEKLPKNNVPILLDKLEFVLLFVL